MQSTTTVCDLGEQLGLSRTVYELFVNVLMAERGGVWKQGIGQTNDEPMVAS